MFLANSCCEFDEDDLVFSQNELELIDDLNLNDRIQFTNKDSTINYVVFETDTSIQTGCILGFTEHSISIKIKCLSDSSENESQIFLTKSPGGKNGLQSNLSVYFKDFSGDIESDVKFKDVSFHYMDIEGTRLNQVIEIESNYMERKSEPDDVTHIYWSKQFGFVAFKTLNGEIWKNKTLL